MNLSQRFRMWAAGGLVKAAKWPIFPAFGFAQFTEPLFTNLLREGYKGNGAVFACVSALAFAFPEPDYDVMRDSKPLAGHPMLDLLNYPNAHMDKDEFRQRTLIYQAIGGNAYWLKVRDRAGRVKELWPLHDGNMAPVMSPTNLISHYELTEDTGETRRVPVEDVVHFMWQPDPAAPWRGMAPLAPVARDVDADNEMTRYLFALLSNNAVPPLVLLMADDTEPPSAAQKQRFDAEWQERYGGTNRGKPAWLGGVKEVKQLSFDLQQLAMDALRRVPEARIAAAYRTPPIVAGLNVGLERSTYSNYEEARASWTESTLVPLWKAYGSEIAHSLLPEYGDARGMTVAPKLDTVIALQGQIQKKRAGVAAVFTAGLLTANEARAEIGYPPHPDGDALGKPQPMLALPASDTEQDADEPEPDPDPEKAARPTWATKDARSKRAMQDAIAASLRMTRREVGGRMEGALDAYFAGLADRVIHRLQEQSGARVSDIQTKKVDPRKLITEDDEEELEELIYRYFMDITQASWETLNLATGTTLAFDLNDLAVTRALNSAGARVVGISDTTLAELRDTLRYAGEQGWGVDRLISGDPAAGVRGIRDVVQQTYKGRAETIARTELGNAQNIATHARYEAAGVTQVRVYDNGLDDDDEPCKQVDGTLQTLDWMEANPLEHPNCTRAFAAEFDT